MGRGKWLDPAPGGADHFLLTCVAAYHSLACLGTALPHIVAIGSTGRRGARAVSQAEHEVDALYIAEVHDLGAAIMAVAMNGDV
jgi:hypothetical protein